MELDRLKKSCEELHIKDVGVFLFDRKNRKAYTMAGKPVKQGEPLWLCEECDFLTWKEIDFAKHMVKEHPKPKKEPKKEPKKKGQKEKIRE